MRRIGLLALVLALAGCAQKPAPQPIDDPPALHPSDPIPVADNSIPPPRPLLRDHTAGHAFEGRKVFLKMQCIRCHDADGTKGPKLEGLYGARVPLKGGGFETADDGYLFDSIRNPRLKVVEGWEPIMPAYNPELLPAEELSALVAYLRSLKTGGVKEEPFPTPVGPPIDRPSGK